MQEHTQELVQKLPPTPEIFLGRTHIRVIMKLRGCFMKVVMKLPSHYSSFHITLESDPLHLRVPTHEIEQTVIHTQGTIVEPVPEQYLLHI